MTRRISRHFHGVDELYSIWFNKVKQYFIFIQERNNYNAYFNILIFNTSNGKMLRLFSLAGLSLTMTASASFKSAMHKTSEQNFTQMNRNILACQMSRFQSSTALLRCESALFYLALLKTLEELSI